MAKRTIASIQSMRINMTCMRTSMNLPMKFKHHQARPAQSMLKIKSQIVAIIPSKPRLVNHLPSLRHLNQRII